MVEAKDVLAVLRDLSQVKGGDHLPYGLVSYGVKGTNLIDANVPLLRFAETELELIWFDRMVRGAKAGCDLRVEGEFIPLEQTVRSILAKETELDQNEYTLHISAGGAREAIEAVLRNVVTTDRPLVAYSSPNWIFEHSVEKVEGAYNFPFSAHSGDSFVEGFESIASKNIAALIVVDPSNPLGYRLTDEHVARIEKVARAQGITVIFDDAFRGLLPDKRTASHYSRSSIIVESSSKSYTGRGLGVTWTLVPKDQRLTSTEGLTIPCDGCTNLAGLVMRGLYETNHPEKVRAHLAQNVTAFGHGFVSVFEGEHPERVLHIPYDSTPILLAEVEPRDVFNSAVLKSLLDKKGIHVTSGVEWIKKPLTGEIPGDEIMLGASYIRICPTKVEPEQAFLAGQEVAGQINQGKHYRDLPVPARL